MLLFNRMKWIGLLALVLVISGMTHMREAEGEEDAYRGKREEMVRHQIEARHVKDPRVLRAMREREYKTTIKRARHQKIGLLQS